MTTSVTTTTPARSDAADREPTRAGSAPGASRSWAVAGIGAAVAGIATVVTSSMVDTVHLPKFEGTTAGLAGALGEKVPVMFAFHSVTVIGAVLMVAFAAGLHRRLQSEMSEQDRAQRGLHDLRQAPRRPGRAEAIIKAGEPGFGRE